MKYAKVVLGIPPEGPFDYILPSEYSHLKAGVRVIVPFQTRRLLGFVVGVSSKSNFKRLKTIQKVLDDTSVLSESYLKLCRRLSRYYCSSWGEMIEAGLPSFMKLRRALPLRRDFSKGNLKRAEYSIELIFDLSRRMRWEEYFKRIRDFIRNGKSVLLIVPESSVLLDAYREIQQACGVEPIIIMKENSYKEGVERMNALDDMAPKVILGMRSAVFLQVRNLGAIILEEEDNPAYKQEQTPCYHAREVAFLRSEMEGIDLILGTQLPSLEVYNKLFASRIKLTVLREDTPACEVSVIDMRSQFLRHTYAKGGSMISLELQNLIRDFLADSRKIIIFSNRSGFAQNVKCPSCGFRFMCQRCNVPLVFHLDRNELICRHCNYKTAIKDICPQCNSGYMRYFSFGIEKMEKELKRIFPTASIVRFDRETSPLKEDYDILITSRLVLKSSLPSCDLLGVLSIDNLLNQVDFRAAEKTFCLLFKLKRMCTGKMVIQTMTPHHYCFDALKKNDYEIFYRNELLSRKELKLPPYRHLILVNLRGKLKEKVEKKADELFGVLKRRFANVRGEDIVALMKNVPFKLRGNFRWQIVIRSRRPESTCLRLKEVLRNFRPSGIIVTVDVDPL